MDFDEIIEGIKFVLSALFVAMLSIVVLFAVIYGVQYLIEILQCRSYLNSDPLNIYKVIGHNCSILIDGYWINTADIYKLLGK